jgi:hypothetical protein
VNFIFVADPVITTIRQEIRSKQFVSDAGKMLLNHHQENQQDRSAVRNA